MTSSLLLFFVFLGPAASYLQMLSNQCAMMGKMLGRLPGFCSLTMEVLKVKGT